MDHDDSMISSPSTPPDHDESTFTHPDEDADQDLFPSTTTKPTSTLSPPRPQTPQNNHLNAAAPGELSPPRSQSQSQPQTTTVPSRNRPLAMDSPAGVYKLNGPSSYLGTTIPSSTTTTTTTSAGGGNVGEYQPGSWKTAKAQDEMSKVWESAFVDREFNIAVYGDVLAHLVPAVQGEENGGGKGGDGMAVFRAALGL